MSAPTVREYLDATLGTTRIRDLERLANEFAGRSLAETVTDVRIVLADGIDLGDFHRLHILISHLYHRCGADIPLTEKLRAEARLSLSRRGLTLDEREEVTPCPAPSKAAGKAAAALTRSPAPASRARSADGSEPTRSPQYPGSARHRG